MVRHVYTEDDVAEAIFDVTDRGLSQTEAAQKRGVPQWTISRRLSGQASRNERIQAHLRISKSQEETLLRWVLRQESLGYAPSHSQLRACVEEAARFDGFTPRTVNWYFDIRENEYGWIKPENTINVDEGGIMAGFADWHYITSPNGWTDNYIALEWLKDVYLPQTKPRDAADARLIILYGHRSHAQTSRQVRDLAKHRSRPTRRKYSKIAKGLEALEIKVAVQNARITGLEEQMAQLRRGKKRKAVPNPNRRFMALVEALAAGEALPNSKEVEIEADVDEEVESVIEVGVRSEDESEDFMVVTKRC
ncbi:hypothetical protein MRS44_018594 [Fusarium solani]|uniref:uncharacterized protein n=1 Tax=Fusarium solani TaxID=169388 RepID=UPI0032C44FB2|nr:hypothetical protein MRS44_018594 [Fusarium solani]